MKVRLDKLLIERGLAATRSRALEKIVSGQVRVDGAVVTKAGFFVESGQSIDIPTDELPYVSRGGLKLAAALDHWKIDVSGRICLDVGISTGGFTDCLLQRGVERVVGVDSGHGQLAEKLRSDPRVLLLEKTNARYLTASMLPGVIGFLAIDVSFIAASLVLPAVVASAFPSASAVGKAVPTLREAVILVKPQFEAGREHVGKHGLVKSPAGWLRAVDRVREAILQWGARETDTIDSPIAGGDRNREFLLYARF